jgi:tRNA threonylcarbamoyladenosine biosynthesis protein TsaB
MRVRGAARPRYTLNSKSSDHMKLLAIETSTETMSLGVAVNGQITTVDAAGGAQASSGAMDEISRLLASVGVALSELEAIVWGSGPGAFTGVRTACAIAQGLGFAQNLPLIDIDALAACAQAAQDAEPDHKGDVVVALDARMGELYVAQYTWGQWQEPDTRTYSLIKPQDLIMPRNALLCGNASKTYPELAALVRGENGCCVLTQPSAKALLQMAVGKFAQGQWQAAKDAHPLYVRNKVAQTTAERELSKASALG